MTTDLTEQVRRWRGRSVCFIGLGDVAAGDRGLGITLARELAARLRGRRTGPRWRVLKAGTRPERVIAGVLDGGFGDVVFLDAADLGASPGAVLLASTPEIEARWPQVSTNRLSLGLLARTIEARGRTRAWLLAVQPSSLASGRVLGPEVRGSVAALVALLCPAHRGVPTAPHVIA